MRGEGGTAERLYGEGDGAFRWIVRMENRQSVHKASVVVRGEGIIVLLRWLWGWRG